MKDVNLVCMDTALAPMDNGTFDSRVTYGAGHAVKNAAVAAKKKLLEVMAVDLGVRADHLECGDGFIYNIHSLEGSNQPHRIGFYEALEKYQNSIGILWGTGDYTPPQPKGNYQGNLIGPSPAFGFAAQVAEVEVDPDTGRIRVVKFWDAGDCGLPINPMSVEGQVHGAISMALDLR